MAQALTKYSGLFSQRLFWPFSPLKPLLQLIKVEHLIIIFLIGNLIGLFRPSPKISIAENLSRWPWSTNLHSQMALMYFGQGNETAAFHELNMAGSGRNKAESVIAKPGLIREEIGIWEKVLETKKYSREILLKLAFLNYLIYQDETAKNYFSQAKYLDPTNKNVIKLGRIISSLD